MNKSMETLRNNLIENKEIQKLLETSTSELTRDLTKKETTIYLFITELVASHKLNNGYQFGIKRFNSLFIKWENGKAWEKSNVLPTITDIVNACKYFYSMNGKNNGFFPIVRINNDGSIILDCITYIENYYNKNTPSNKKELTRDKALKQLAKMIDTFNDIKSVLEKSDINDFIKCIKSRNNAIENALENIA